MIELLKEIILDTQRSRFFTGTRRKLEVSLVPNKATIIIGVRRSGKSTYLNQLAKQWIDKGVSPENILYINFFDDRLADLRTHGLDQVIQAYYLLFPDKKQKETIYCYFDEIQVIPGWEAFIDRLLRTENCLIYISGSSAKMLSKEIATQMRGRALSWEIFPFSFAEFADHKHINNQLPADGQQRLFLQGAFDEFITSGGFPEVIGLEKSLRVKIHQEYFESVLFRDLIERYDISHPRAVVDLARKLLENISSMYTLNSLTGYLKAFGYNVSKTAVSEYLKWFEDAYFLYTVRLFDASFSRSNANPKKVYCVDHALVRSVTSGILVNSGHILENIVFVALRRLYPEVFYFKTKGNQEIDFIIRNHSGELMIYQVCESLANPSTRQREINALQHAMAELNLSTSYLITKYEEEKIQLNSGIIEVLPAWRFLLELSS